MRKKTGLLATFGAVASIPFIFALSHSFQNATFPEYKGVEYLEGRGYTDVAGGERAYFMHGCGKDTARRYTATPPNSGNGNIHRRVERIVCHNPLYGAHAPLLGMSY